MAKLIPIDKSRHQSLRFIPQDPHSLLKGQHLIPLFAQEFEASSVHFPIVFAKDAETGQFSPAALVGLEPKENLFLNENDRWIPNLVPLSSRRMGIVAIPKEGSDVLTICVYDDLRYLSEAEGELLFDESGNQTKALETQMNLAAEIRALAEHTKSFIDTLLKHRLITPTRVAIQEPGGETYDLNGLYGIDEERLNEMPADDFAGFRDNGYLRIVYSMIFSKPRLNDLLQMKVAKDMI